MDTELCLAPAVEQLRRLRSREVSCEELMRMHLERIECLNPSINAIVTLLPERALDAARQADAALARGADVGPLHGLPIAHKDLALTKGVRTTFGSLAMADFVPQQDSLIVERLRDAGAVMIGKTNTPEFGAGSQTFNEVFGVTRNPWDLTRTAGGSSGGAAAALAAGMLPIADGSDMGGSLRNPAAFCNVVGLRPTPGRVPMWPTELPWMTLGVEGPMARTVEDCALLLSAMAGPDPRSPISIAEGGERFRGDLGREFRGTRIAISADFGGLMPIEASIVSTVACSRSVFESIGCVADEALPDFGRVDFAFRALRAWIYMTSCGALYERHRELMKPTLIWNIEQGLTLSASDLSRAERARTAVYHRMREFMQCYEFVVLPVTQVEPFDAGTEYPASINGVPMDTYLDWMQSCYFVTVTGHPAISVPCGFTESGLPVGVQIVGRYGDDLGVLQLARAFEQATGFASQRPPLDMQAYAARRSTGGAA